MRTSFDIKKLKTERKLLYRVVQSIHSLKIDDLLKEIVKITLDVTRGDSCLVYILDANHKELVLRASKNPHPNLLKKIKMKLGVGITGWVAMEKKPVSIVNGAYRDPRFKFFRNLPEDKYEAFLSVPIVNNHGVYGVINVQHRKMHRHSKMEMNLMTTIGKLVSGAVENAILIEQTLELKEALELRKIIEKAKGILMKRKNINEDQAYEILQKESMNTRKSLKDIADAIILAERLNFRC